MTGWRRTLAIGVLAVAGLVLAAGLTTAASSLSNQSVGLSSEPLTAGRGLAPAASPTATADPTADPTPRRTRTPRPATPSDRDRRSHRGADRRRHTAAPAGTTTAAPAAAARAAATTAAGAAGAAGVAAATTTDQRVRIEQRAATFVRTVKAARWPGPTVIRREQNDRGGSRLSSQWAEQARVAEQRVRAGRHGQLEAPVLEPAADLLVAARLHELLEAFDVHAPALDVLAARARRARFGRSAAAGEGASAVAMTTRRIRSP